MSKDEKAARTDFLKHMKDLMDREERRKTKEKSEGWNKIAKVFLKGLIKGLQKRQKEDKDKSDDKSRMYL